MKENEVKIIQLEALHVASFHAFGSQPENSALEKLQAWAKPRGLLDLKQHRIFGFNNPSPSSASPNYGYEFWLVIDPEVAPDDDVEIKDFPGGLYAVSRVGKITDPNVDIPEAWKQLALWLEDSPYHMGRHQWLEEMIEEEGAKPGEWTLDLYLPVTR